MHTNIRIQRYTYIHAYMHEFIHKNQPPSIITSTTDKGRCYNAVNAAGAVASVGLMCSAIDALSKWMASNRLLLNPSKTQFIWLGGRRQLAKVDLPMLADKFPHFAFSTTVRELGLTLDQELNLSEHVNLIT